MRSAYLAARLLNVERWIVGEKLQAGLEDSWRTGAVQVPDLCRRFKVLSSVFLPGVTEPGTKPLTLV